jgi:hypothetical protein
MPIANRLASTPPADLHQKGPIAPASQPVSKRSGSCALRLTVASCLWNFDNRDTRDLIQDDCSALNASRKAPALCGARSSINTIFVYTVYPDLCSYGGSGGMERDRGVQQSVCWFIGVDV